MIGGNFYFLYVIFSNEDSGLLYLHHSLPRSLSVVIITNFVQCCQTVVVGNYFCLLACIFFFNTCCQCMLHNLCIIFTVQGLQLSKWIHHMILSCAHFFSYSHIQDIKSKISDIIFGDLSAQHNATLLLSGYLFSHIKIFSLSMANMVNSICFKFGLLWLRVLKL